MSGLLQLRWWCRRYALLSHRWRELIDPPSVSLRQLVNRIIVRGARRNDNAVGERTSDHLSLGSSFLSPLRAFGIMATLRCRLAPSHRYKPGAVAPAGWHCVWRVL